MRRDTHKRKIALVLVIIFLTRLPYLSAGFGSDDDAWRVAVTATRLRSGEEYIPSRLPGYPVQEYVTALVVPYGAVAVNLLSVLMVLLAAASFAKILLHIQHREPYLAAFAFACVPMVYIASVSAIDYIWALAFVLLAVWRALSQQALLSGAALGLAVGTRITSALFLVPLAILLYERSRWGVSLSRIATLAAVAGIISTLAFYPVYRRYGWGFLSYVESRDPLLIALAQATVGLFGTVGTVAIVALLVWRVSDALRRRKFAAEALVLPQPMPAPLRRSLWVAAVLIILAYLRLPVEAGYLLPLVPMVLIALSAVLTRAQFRWLCVSLIISPFVLGIPSPLMATLVQPTAAAVPLPAPKIGSLQSLWVDPLQGPLLLDYQKRQRMDTIMRFAVEVAPKLPPNSVILCDALHPGVVYYNRDKHSEAIFTQHSREHEVRRLIQSGYRVYSLPWVRERILWEWGYDIFALGVKPLTLPTEDTGESHLPKNLLQRRARPEPVSLLSWCITNKSVR